MIVVKVELWSAVDGRKEVLGMTTISNVGGSRERGDYEARVFRKPHAQSGNVRAGYDKPLRRGRVEDYPRLSYNVWRLVIRALKSAFPEEK